MNIVAPKGLEQAGIVDERMEPPSMPEANPPGISPPIIVPPPGRGAVFLSWVGRILVSKTLTFVLAALALAIGLSTFIILVRGTPLGLTPGSALEPRVATSGPRPGVVAALVLANISVLLLLGAVLAGRLTRVWAERRRGSAGSQLHVRLVLLFSGVAVAPTILVACFAVAFFHFGIHAWFNDPVRAVLAESLLVSRGYLEEHRNTIRSDALEMANDLARAGQYLAADPSVFVNVLNSQTELRGLTEAVIYDPGTDDPSGGAGTDTGRIYAAAGLFVGFGVDLPPPEISRKMQPGDVLVLDGGDGTRVRAVARLNTPRPVLLLIGRPVDPTILGYMTRTEQAVSEYQRLDESQSWLQITFAWIFAVVALLVLLAAALIGLVIANQIARPIGTLINAAERVRGGDLGVRVTEMRTRDELAGLSRAFNRMTGQLAAQRAELMEAYSQIDGRRRFTETVLSGVSAGVIGLDARGRIELPNRTAAELLSVDLLAAIGRDLEAVVPEFATLIQAARAAPEKPLTEEIRIGPPTRPMTLLARIGAEMTAGRVNGFVVTFDDITELQLAQRKAAWSDVARRIAHEIKNPLTPIQLAAERLKRRFTKEITSDPETFGLCADTIIRHVGDIGRMVDEFSAFARMPQPVIKPEDIGLIARETLVLQKTALPGIEWISDIPPRGPVVPCDRRMMRQALTNLLRNAADAVAMRDGAGTITVAVTDSDGLVSVRVTDDGIGLPQEDRERLTEPYVTHKPKGTGLGLAIVKKIMEDHGGQVILDDRQDGPGTVAALVLPSAAPAPGTQAASAAGSLAASAAGTHHGA